VCFKITIGFFRVTPICRPLVQGIDETFFMLMFKTREISSFVDRVFWNSPVSQSSKISALRIFCDWCFPFDTSY